jgi:hypothetical protein
MPLFALENGCRDGHQKIWEIAMSMLEWQDSWSVGNSSLDDDHKRLISTIQKVGGHRTLSKDLGGVISSGLNYYI